MNATRNLLMTTLALAALVSLAGPVQAQVTIEWIVLSAADKAENQCDRLTRSGPPTAGADPCVEAADALRTLGQIDAVPAPVDDALGRVTADPCMQADRPGGVLDHEACCRSKGLDECPPLPNRGPVEIQNVKEKIATFAFDAMCKARGVSYVGTFITPIIDNSGLC